jgi:predicted MPP superfamily phosphohydrolase
MGGPKVLPAVLVFFYHALWDIFRKTNFEARITPKRAVVCVFVYGYFEARNVRLVHFVIPTDKLPDGIGLLSVVQISDIHLGGLYYTSRLERVMKTVRSVKPDILVLTDDLVDGNMKHMERESNILASHGAKY